MTSMQRPLLRLLRILRFVRDHIVGRAAGSWSWFIAFLGRRMSEFRRSCGHKPGTSQNPTAADQLLPGRSYSASGGSAVLRDYVVAASTVPGPLAASSASRASFQEDAGQSAGVTLTVPPSPTTNTSIPVDLSAHQLRPLYGRSRSAGSSGSLSGWSAQSRTSEGFSRIANSQVVVACPC